MARTRGGSKSSKPPQSKPARPRKGSGPSPDAPSGAFIDSRGRWRDSAGHFLSHGTLFRDFFPGSFNDVGIYLQDLASTIKQPAGADKRRRFIVAGRFLGLPEDRSWRMLANAFGLRTAVHQAGGRLRFSKKFNRYTLAQGGQQGPQIVTELSLHELPPSKGPGKKPKKLKPTKKLARKPSKKPKKPSPKKPKKTAKPKPRSKKR